MDPRIKYPFMCVVARRSSSGKTQSVFRLIRRADPLVDPPPKRRTYCYGELQPSFLELPLVEFHEGLPNIDSFDGWFRVLLILDDLMNEADQNVCNLHKQIHTNKCRLCHKVKFSPLHLSKKCPYTRQQQIMSTWTFSSIC